MEQSAWGTWASCSYDFDIIKHQVETTAKTFLVALERDSDRHKFITVSHSNTAQDDTRGHMPSAANVQIIYVVNTRAGAARINMTDRMGGNALQGLWNCVWDYGLYFQNTEIF